MVEPRSTGLDPVGEALQRGDPDTALTLLSHLQKTRPLRIEEGMQRVFALRATGRHAEALEAIEAVLVVDPYHFLALLSKGAVLERLAGRAQAAAIYRHAIQVGGPVELMPPQVRDAVGRGAGSAGCRSPRPAEKDSRTRPARSGRPAPTPSSHGSMRRWPSSPAWPSPTNSNPMLLDYPGLAPIAFYDRALFPWLEAVEAATPVIQAELAAMLKTSQDIFAPYIQYPPGVPVNQWGKLNHSRLWSSIFLWKDGVRQDEICARFPRTVALLDGLPLLRQPGFGPTVTFSALAPHTRIPPHTGSSNTRVLMHLPLILPGPARFRVGNTVREWRMGEAWVFDDTIEHEAWNDAAETRIILILDLWSPQLSENERSLVTQMMLAKTAYQRGEILDVSQGSPQPDDNGVQVDRD